MTPSQTLLLWCVLGRGGQGLQKDILPKVEKADREALVSGGYVTSAKGPRGAIIINVEDKGWRWASEHLSDPLPVKYRVLQEWLTLLHRQLARSGETLADFIVAVPDPKTSDLSEHDVRARIEKAYLTETGGRKAESVTLVKMRAALADLDRSVVDQALLQILRGDIVGNRKARLIQNSDPKSLTPEEHAAAFNPAGDPYHVLWIQS